MPAAEGAVLVLTRAALNERWGTRGLTGRSRFGRATRRGWFVQWRDDPFAADAAFIPRTKMINSTPTRRRASRAVFLACAGFAMLCSGTASACEIERGDDGHYRGNCRFSVDGDIKSGTEVKFDQNGTF